MKNREHLIDGIAKKMKMKLISSPDLVLAVSRKGKIGRKKPGRREGREWRGGNVLTPSPPPFSHFLSQLFSLPQNCQNEVWGRDYGEAELAWLDLIWHDLTLFEVKVKAWYQLIACKRGREKLLCWKLGKQNITSGSL